MQTTVNGSALDAPSVDLSGLVVFFSDTGCHCFEPAEFAARSEHISLEDCGTLVPYLVAWHPGFADFRNVSSWS